MEDRVLKAIYDGLKEGKKSAMVTLIHNEGSTPRESGAVMAVWEDGNIAGTIGGGNLEKVSIEKALECMSKNKNREFSFDLSNEGNLNMQCGGNAKVYVKVFNPRKKLIIAGGGHIGIELYKLANILGFYTIIIDDREEFANKHRFHEADEVLVGDIEKVIQDYEIDANTYIIIVTRGHKCDQEALRASVNRGAAYIGVIGSKGKTEHVMNNLINEGIAKEELMKVYAPIGLDIADGEPNEIAFSIMSEILLIKNSGTLSHMRDKRKIKFNEK